ncbi:MAG: hypothetical protein LBQ23_01240 [Puniceicoccales bacterium]|jgi:hypothetical protein|nr:hypothetical protein [Puniceicoccales bacterium]
MSDFTPNEKYDELLQYFGEAESKGKQVANLKKLLGDIRSINDTVKQEYPNKFIDL